MVLNLSCVKHNEIVDYPLFLLKGTFYCHSGCYPNATTETNCVLFRSLSKSSPRVLLKALIPLHIGENIVRISCPHTSYNFTINNVRKSGAEFYVRCVYVIFKNHDGKFQAPPTTHSDLGSACRRLGLAVRLLQTLTAETILAGVGSRRTFTCAGDTSIPSLNPPHLVASPLSAAVWCMHSEIDFQEAQNLSPLCLWERLARELDSTFKEDRGRGKWLAVISCTEFMPVTDSEVTPVSHEEVVTRTKGYCTLGTGGLALIGSGTLYTWPERLEEVGPCLMNISQVNKREFLDDSAYRGTYWANYTTALGIMLHELGHCFDLDHTSEGIMRRGGDDLNLLLAFPPPGTSADLHQSQGECPSRRLSIFQFENVTFYENVLQHKQNKYDEQYLIWGDCDSIEDSGRAFWGKYIAQFLFYHRWFVDMPVLRGECDMELKKGILSSSLGIRIIQIRIGRDICSPDRARLWNSTSHVDTSKLPLDISLMQGCIVWHKVLSNPRKKFSVAKILRSTFLRLQISTLKVVALDRSGWVLHKIVSEDCLAG